MMRHAELLAEFLLLVLSALEKMGGGKQPPLLAQDAILGAVSAFFSLQASRQKRGKERWRQTIPREDSL